MEGFLTSDKSLFFWNTSADVGLNCPNRPEDAQLVHFGLVCMAKLPAAMLSVELTKMISNLVIGAPCSGKPDDPLVMAIIAYQNEKPGLRDKKVSVLQTGVYTLKGVVINALLVRLNSAMIYRYRDIYPRIDKAPDCPPLVQAYVRKVMSAD